MEKQLRATSVVTSTSDQFLVELESENQSTTANSPLSKPDALLSKPVAIPGLEIIKKIGSGSSSSVYLARTDQQQDFVAVKVLNQTLLYDSAAVKRFQKEAEAITRLDHPNIANLYAYGLLDDGRPYLVLEYIQGATMEEQLRKQGKLGFEESVRLFSQIAEGLAAAHEAGICHRDIKPGNVLIDKSKLIKIVDFGLARIDEEGNATITSTVMAAGTPAYMSPEQCMGTPYDQRSDIYSLGCMLYECLSGDKVFSAKNGFACMQQHAFSLPEPVSYRRPDVPFALEEVTMKCLRKDAKDRYTSVPQFLEALNQSLDSTKKNRRGRDLLRWTRDKKQGIASLAGMLAILLSAGLFFLSSKTQNSTSPPLSASHMEQPDQEVPRWKVRHNKFDQKPFFIDDTGHQKMDASLFQLATANNTKQLKANLADIRYDSIEVIVNGKSWHSQLDGSFRLTEKTSTIAAGQFSLFGPIDTRRMNLPFQPWGLAVPPDQKTTYLSDCDRISAITSSGYPVQLPSCPGEAPAIHGIAYDSKLGRLLTLATQSYAVPCSLVAFDPKTETWSVFNIIGLGYVTMMGLAYSPSDGLLYSIETTPGPEPVLRVMHSDGRLVERIAVPELIYGLRADPNVQLAVSGDYLVATVTPQSSPTLEPYAQFTSTYLIERKTGKVILLRAH